MGLKMSASEMVRLHMRGKISDSDVSAYWDTLTLPDRTEFLHQKKLYLLDFVVIALEGAVREPYGENPTTDRADARRRFVALSHSLINKLVGFEVAFDLLYKFISKSDISLRIDDAVKTATALNSAHHLSRLGMVTLTYLELLAFRIQLEIGETNVPNA